MKTLLKILFFCLFTALLTMAAMANDPSAKWKTVGGKDKELFVLKANRKFLGAHVSIVQANGSVLAEQILKKRKLVIDFNSIRSGAYIIRLKKGDFVQEFTYTKEED